MAAEILQILIDDFEDMKKPAEPDADGWIEHTGDECPVDPDTRVIVRLRSGKESEDAIAGDWSWGWRAPGAPGAITHYRITEKPAEPDADGWIEHTDGSKCPVGRHTRVDVIRDNGGKAFSTLALAWAWATITHYRITEKPAEPDADGWIEHTGDECPVDFDTRVDVRTSTGREFKNRPGNGFGWEADFTPAITHYRIAKDSDA